jgi:membrane-associated protease RseP (regulator of RpoE activity)
MPLLNLALFLLTLLSTTAKGALDMHNGASVFPLVDGLSFSIPLMTILLCHEMGHYIAARIHRVPASLPLFIPLPPTFGLFGTMGAVILQSHSSDRRKLIDIGAAGPLAGLAVAIPVLIYGLSLSTVQPLHGVGMQEGNSILYAVLKRLVHGVWLPSGGRDVILHPTALAGWAGLLITMLNLLPLSQLDGGHVAYAYFGNRYGRASRLLHALLPVLAIGVTIWVYLDSRAVLARLGLPISALTIAANAGFPWLTWFVLIALLHRLSGGVDHPPVDDRDLPPSRARLFWVVLATFVIIFMPVPMRSSLGPSEAAAPPDGQNTVHERAQPIPRKPE